MMIDTSALVFSALGDPNQAHGIDKKVNAREWLDSSRARLNLFQHMRDIS